MKAEKKRTAGRRPIRGSACPWSPTCSPRHLVTSSLALLFLHTTAHAQLLAATNVPITITGGTEVTVQGGLLLENTATIANDGDLRVEGDWTNNSGGSGMLPAGTGNVRLYGGAQQITGFSVTDFRHLIITGGTKHLLQNAVVGLPGQPDGTLQLGAVLSLEGSTFTVCNPAGAAVVDAGGSVRSEDPALLGRFQWALGADVSEHRVPFSTTAGTVFPFAFTPAAPYAANTLLGVATYPTTPANTPYAVTANQQVLHVMGAMVADNSPSTADRFWLVDLPDGSFTGALLLSHTPPEDPAFGPGPISAQRWLESAGTWEAPAPGQSNPGLREALVPAVPFSHAINPVNEHIWLLAYDFSPLPISLLHFDAHAVGNRYVHCTWATASELNNNFFTVERSRDAMHFEDVGHVPGAGTSHAMLHYALDDMAPYMGQSYYRLRQTDLDGTRSWSQTVPVWFTGAGPTISVFPNPNNGRFTILRTEVEWDLPLRLLDASGRVVREWIMPLGMDRQWVDLGTASGLFTLTWQGGRAKVSVSAR